MDLAVRRGAQGGKLSRRDCSISSIILCLSLLLNLALALAIPATLSDHDGSTTISDFEPSASSSDRRRIHKREPAPQRPRDAREPDDEDDRPGSRDFEMQTEDTALQNVIQNALGDIQIDLTQGPQGVAQGQVPANNLPVPVTQANLGNQNFQIQSPSSESSEDISINLGTQQNPEPRVTITQQQREFLLPGFQSPDPRNVIQNRRTSMFESPAPRSAIEEEMQGSDNRSRESRSSPPQNRRSRYIGLFGGIDPAFFESPSQSRPTGRRGRQNMRNFFDAPIPFYETADSEAQNEEEGRISLGSMLNPPTDTRQLGFGMGDMNRAQALGNPTSLQQFAIDLGLGEHGNAYPETQNDFQRVRDLIEEIEDFQYQPVSQGNLFGQSRTRMVDTTGGLGDYRVWEEVKDEDSDDNSGGMNEDTN
ncbi:hypothetical protein TWF696_004220 [Orbilia brochopaga]|uniref:Uncharacterized protein n=1 Tax=Orbilia brochopaga TaxID=3140254 RepID=A0AAV9VBZ9_9PEZI